MNDLNQKVRLISGEKNIVVSMLEAQRQATLAGMDLVIIDPKSSPPVVKIMDEGKYKYDLAKRQKKLHKQQRENASKQKEIQLRPVTGDNDIKIKAKNIIEFLGEGHTVKITVKFRGREHSHVSMGENVVSKLLEYIGSHKIIHDTRGSGKDLTVIVSKNDDE